MNVQNPDTNLVARDDFHLACDSDRKLYVLEDVANFIPALVLDKGSHQT